MKFSSPIRSFSKHIANPIAGKIAHSAHGPYVIIQHVGRRSGKFYETPVRATPTTSGFIFGLTFGPEVDWYRNVMAAGRCVVLWHCKAYTIERIEPITVEAAQSLLHQPEKTIRRLIKTQNFIRMTYQ